MAHTTGNRIMREACSVSQTVRQCRSFWGKRKVNERFPFDFFQGIVHGARRSRMYLNDDDAAHSLRLRSNVGLHKVSCTSFLMGLDPMRGTKSVLPDIHILGRLSEHEYAKEIIRHHLFVVIVIPHSTCATALVRVHNQRVGSG